tara:strand:+ start:178 stop:846 length:669 start_codon:yes stop_codon:yes gene_type:complete
MIKLLLFVFLIIPFSVNSQEVIQITCDEEIKLEIDEVNMTNEEIVKAKDLYFKKLLAQANQECISQLAQTADLNVAQTNSGGSISGSDVQKTKVSTPSKTLGTPKLNNGNNNNVANNTNSGNQNSGNQNLGNQNSGNSNSGNMNSANTNLANTNSGNINNSTNSNITDNGAVPACIANIKDNNQVSAQLKESIAKENDPILKNELIRKYAIYNNLEPENLKC